jgi:hypothetical protein
MLFNNLILFILNILCYFSKKWVILCKFYITCRKTHARLDRLDSLGSILTRVTRFLIQTD